MAAETLSPEERARADEARRFAATGDVEALIARLTEPSWAVRRVVISLLAELGDAAVGPLSRALVTRRDDETRIAALVDTLGLSRGDVETVLLELAGSADFAVVCDALQLFGRRRATSAIGRIAELALHEDDNVGLAAIEALGRIGGEAVVEPLVDAVRRGNFFRRFPAIDALGRSGDPRAVPPLVALLADPTLAVDAARALGRAGDLGAVRPLARTLVKGHDAQLRESTLALGEIDDRVRERFGEGIRDELVAALEAPPTVARRLLQLLPRASGPEKAAISRLAAWLGGEEAAAALVELVARDAAAAPAAIDALRSLGTAADGPVLHALADPASEGPLRARLLPLVNGRKIARDAVLACLDDESAAVRVLAANALGSMGDPSAVGRLFALIDDPDDLASHAVVSAIQALGSAETERLALDAAGSKVPRRRRAAIRIVSYFGYPSALEPLLDAASGDDDRIRDAAIGGLAYLEDPRAITAILGLSAHPTAGTRAAAARALGRARKNEAMSARLGELLGDADAWVRYYACQALARLGDATFVDRIGGLVVDPAGQVRIVAVESLAKLRGDAAFDVLAAAARSGDADLRRAAVTALGQLGSDAARAVLEEAAGQGDAATRLVAASALAQHRGPAVVAALGRISEDADANVRRAAIALLAARAEPEADALLVTRLGSDLDRDAVVAALAQPSPGRVAAVAAALAGADEPANVAALVAVLVRARRPEASIALQQALKSGSVPARRAAAAALVAARLPSTRALLEEAAQRDDDATVRSIAASGLEPL